MIKKPYYFFLLLMICSMLILVGCGGKVPANQSLSPSQTNAAEAAADPSNNAAEEIPAVEDPGVPLVLQGMGNTSANLLHGGIAAEYDGYIYHVDKMMEGNLWRTPASGGESELIQKGSFHDLNVNGGVIFTIGSVSMPDDDNMLTYGIFMMKTDGSELKLVKGGNFEELILCDEYIYYADIVDGGLYRMKYDGSGETLLLENIYDNFTIINGSIYILAELDEEQFMNIYKMPLDGSAPPELIVKDTFGGSMDTALDKIFYTARDNSNNMYSFDTNTGEVKEFLSKWVYDVNTDGEYLYCFWNGNKQDNSDSGLYRMKPDGSEESMILQVETLFDLNIAGGKLFWHNNDEQRRLTFINIDGSDMRFVEKAF